MKSEIQLEVTFGKFEMELGLHVNQLKGQHDDLLTSHYVIVNVSDLSCLSLSNVSISYSVDNLP